MFANINMINIIFISLGSMFPDVDTRTSTLGKFNPFSIFMKHRGRLHTILGAILFTSIVYLFFPEGAISFGYGYFIHLLLDTLTPKGIMWLYPYSKRYYSLVKKAKKSKKQEKVNNYIQQY